ncbi:putative bifunctional diguanylate cyclase/phosphodiesterase [Billgrantia montanilacus]|uniref:Diguanylate cyclase n=1 Tax=Billgrantia montanilacus TaxID=2282305 RepID=A0A368U7B3_9GAMM|nr:GGDEF and EAL domain-containing protein [Halomonas montanilacus]RCV90953.1 diguanylate cyclase [Halomonas montanilacus]
MSHHGKRPPGDRVKSLDQHPARLTLSAFEQGQTGMVITDAAGLVVLANESFCQIAGCERSEVAGWPVEHFFVSLRTPATNPAGPDTSIDDATSWQQEVLCRRNDGESMPVLMTVDALLDDQQRPHHYLRTFISLASPKGKQFGDRHWVHVDPMTGLPNWLLLRDRLNHALAQADRADNGLAVLFIDIDRFKAVNDAAGHLEGDRLLGELAQRLQKALRSRDTLARLGGDQFIVLLEKDGTAEAAQAVTERLQEALEPPFLSENRYLLLTASIGIALYPADAQDEETLITAARSAMYTARRKGPGRQAFVDHRLTAKLKEKHRLENRLSEAIHLPERHFQLHYQPEIDIDTGHCTGLEAVLRWKQPKQWQEPPAALLDTIDRLGLGIRLDRWAIQTVIAHHLSWLESGSLLGKLPVSIRLCESHLVNDTLDRRPLDHFLRLQSLDNLAWLTLQVPGQGLSSDLDAASHMLKRLERLGVRLAIDDLGASPIDLTWLSRLPFDKARISVSLAMTPLLEERNLADALCQLLQALHIEPVITDIDDPSQVSAVSGLSLRRVQGDHYCPALPAEKLDRWLAERHAARG